MTSPSFTRLATVSASTKRPPSVSSGKRGTATTNVANLSCTPLDPIDSETRARLVIDSPAVILETFMQADVDIVMGDILVVGSTEYPVKVVEGYFWPPDDTTYRHVFVERLKS
jgi:hypothetical protein